jgi:hypothetical protein
MKGKSAPPSSTPVGSVVWVAHCRYPLWPAIVTRVAGTRGAGIPWHVRLFRGNEGADGAAAAGAGAAVGGGKLGGESNVPSDAFSEYTDNRSVSSREVAVELGCVWAWREGRSIWQRIGAKGGAVVGVGSAGESKDDESQSTSLYVLGPFRTYTLYPVFVAVTCSLCYLLSIKIKGVPFHLFEY